MLAQEQHGEQGQSERESEIRESSGSVCPGFATDCPVQPWESHLVPGGFLNGTGYLHSFKICPQVSLYLFPPIYTMEIMSLLTQKGVVGINSIE